VSLLCVIAGAGCASPGHSKISLDSPPPVRESGLSDFGRIGLLLPGRAPEFDFRYPRTSSEAFFRTAEETWKTLDPDHDVGDVIASLVVSGTIGLFGGAISGVPAQDIAAADQAIRRVLEDQPILHGISNRVQSFVSERGMSPLIIVPPELAAYFHQTDPDERDYGLLSSLGLDTVMEFAVEQHGFRAPERGNPPMMLEATLHIHITRVSDGALLFSWPVRYHGHQYRFKQWAAEDARKFRGEMNRVGRMVGRSIVDQVFPVASVEKASASSSRAD
jgi:hypothetical protein